MPLVNSGNLLMFKEDISRIFYEQFTTKSLFSGSVDEK